MEMVCKIIKPKKKHNYNCKIIGDDFKYIRKYYKRWLFGPLGNDTGDITNYELLIYYRNFN